MPKIYTNDYQYDTFKKSGKYQHEILFDKFIKIDPHIIAIVCHCKKYQINKLKKLSQNIII